jgi:hypothetical protein
MFRLYPSEEFREIEFEEKPRLRYAISNMGRIVSFKDHLRDGHILKGSYNNGSLSFQYKIQQNGKTRYFTFSYSTLVAKAFVPEISDEHRYAVHIDHDTLNNKASNLKWVTYEGKLAHHRKSPHVLAAQKNAVGRKIKSEGRKLTVTQVMHLKKRLLDPNRKTRMKILAKQFGVSEMQLYRIKSGENWGYIKV